MTAPTQGPAPETRLDVEGLRAQGTPLPDVEPMSHRVLGAIHAAYKHGYARGHAHAEARLPRFVPVVEADLYLAQLPAPTEALLDALREREEALRSLEEERDYWRKWGEDAAALEARRSGEQAERYRSERAVLDEALRTLADFAMTAPGRLPQRVQDAVALARSLTPESPEARHE